MYDSSTTSSISLTLNPSCDDGGSSITSYTIEMLREADVTPAFVA